MSLIQHDEKHKVSLLEDHNNDSHFDHSRNKENYI